MGAIEDILFDNYRKAIEAGNLRQAEMVVDIIKLLKTRIEVEGFIDFPNRNGQAYVVVGDSFNPHPYKYYPEKNVVLFENSVIKLTSTENKLFYLLSSREFNKDKINIISNSDIKAFLWPQSNPSSGAVRLAIKRLREKIESNPTKPQILVNFYNKGYVFLGKKVE